jgi:tetratricopeptide (TPR) repeat protein
MKAINFLVLPALFLGGSAAAQTTNAPAAPRPHVIDVPQPEQPAEAAAHSLPGSAENDPAKIADFQRRFKEGNDLAAQGKLADARKIYDGILAEDPHARGSLFEAGKISFKLGEMAKADDYLSQLHQLEPEFPAAIELLIQVNQALKRDVKVELLIRDFRALRDSGKNPQLARSICFVRERFAVEHQQIVVSQFFDYTQDPNTVWMAEVFDANGVLQRRLLLNYDAEATRGLRAKDAKYATTEIFTWFEHVLTSGQVTAVNAYLQIFALPDYTKFRSAMLVILANPPKPIYSAPVGAAPATTAPGP